MNKTSTRKIVFSGLFLALALVLPFLTGQIPEIGGMLLPMHLPVLICGLFLGPICGGAVGFIAPILRSLIWGMPYLLPTAVGMAFELCAYGIVSGLIIMAIGRSTFSTYLALIVAMVIGRIVYGGAATAIYSLMGMSYSWTLFVSGTIVSGIPGIILQLVIVPPVVLALNKYIGITYQSSGGKVLAK
ncbi:MAG: ECF transporter S component [Bacillota bacterium]